MKSVTVFHNPKAGDEAYSKTEIISLIQRSGYDCRYYSTKKKSYKNFKTPSDLLVAAGGDGTVGKALKRLETRKLADRIPVAVLPLGTANNISNSLEIKGKVSELIGRWDTARPKQFDLLRTSGDVRSICFESVGFGVFTELIIRMMRHKKELGQEDKLKLSLNQLYDIVAGYPGKEASIAVDQKVHSGKFLWIEIMNVRSIGPNIAFSPRCDPGDGQLNVVLIRDEQRDELLSAIERKISGIDQDFTFNTLQAPKVRIHFEDTKMHVDDQLIDMGRQIELTVEVDPGVFTFLI